MKHILCFIIAIVMTTAANAAENLTVAVNHRPADMLLLFYCQYPQHSPLRHTCYPNHTPGADVQRKNQIPLQLRAAFVFFHAAHSYRPPVVLS